MVKLFALQTSELTTIHLNKNMITNASLHYEAKITRTQVKMSVLTYVKDNNHVFHVKGPHS